MNPQKYSNVQPTWHLIILSIATLGLYDLYWFYRNWKHFKNHKGLNIRPGWRTVGIFVPIYGLFLIWEQFEDSYNYAEEASEKKTKPFKWALGWYIVCNLLFRLPHPYWLLTNLAVFALVDMQKRLNSYWRHEQPDLPIRAKLSARQWIVVICGVLYWALVL